MNVFLVLACAALVAGAKLPTEQLGGSVQPLRYYHESVGIPEAARIRRAEADTSRIAGGAPAVVGTYPYLAGLVITLTSGATSVCGATLMSNTRALTAAHCWWDGRSQGRQLEVVLGSRTLFMGGERVHTNYVEVHENWNTLTLVNDIAMIVFPWVTFTTLIQPVALVPAAIINNTFSGTRAQAVGYGRTHDGASIAPNQFQSHVTMTVITNAVCRQTFAATNVVATTLCTSGDAGVGICGGDLGGPLTMINSGIPVLIGVASFYSAMGCQVRHPAAFTRVTAYDAWIRSMI